jgi:hypothetical protein
MGVVLDALGNFAVTSMGQVHKESLKNLDFKAGTFIAFLKRKDQTSR